MLENQFVNKLEEGLRASAYINSSDEFDSLFKELNEVEIIPDEYRFAFREYCGYSNFEDMAALYPESHEIAFKYAKGSNNVDKYFYVLGKIAQTGELPAEYRISTSAVTEILEAPASAGADTSASAISLPEGKFTYLQDPEFAVKCYQSVSEKSEFYKAAQVEIANIWLASADAYTGEEREEVLRMAIEAAVNSGDPALIVMAVNVCANKKVGAEISATSLGDLVYKLAVQQREPAKVNDSKTSAGGKRPRSATPIATVIFDGADTPVSNDNKRPRLE
jgi:hypothetical protein